MEGLNDKYSIKNLLFTKAIPNRVIPVPFTGYKVFPCNDCGDKFIFESSYEHHVNRKSVYITYLCKHCGDEKIFYNRCNLLSHIRSHSFKTATINVGDLNVEPLPLNHFNITLESVSTSFANNSKATTPPSENKVNKPSLSTTTCHECKNDITVKGPAYKNRKLHFMQFTNEVYSCPVCLFTLPTECGLKTHLRLHLQCPPYYCPECGVHLPNKNVQYPYNHDCDGFNMMRATARLKCTIKDECTVFHPNSYKDHMKQNHLRKVYKCQLCVVACFNEGTMLKHLKNHEGCAKALLFYQCELCPGRLVLQNHMIQHLKSHTNSTVYPCWTCGQLFKNVDSLLIHHINLHKDNNPESNKLILSITNECNRLGKQRIYRVVKRCGQCKRSFIYKCLYSEIAVLPNICPYKCNESLKSIIELEGTEQVNSQLVCHMCKSEISQDWEQIKKHFAIFHKKYRCLDLTVRLTRMNETKLKEVMQKKRNKDTKMKRKNTKNNQKRKLIGTVSSNQPTPSIVGSINSNQPTPSTSGTINSSQPKPSTSETINNIQPKPSAIETINDSQPKLSTSGTINSQPKPTAIGTINNSQSKPSAIETINSNQPKLSITNQEEQTCNKCGDKFTSKCLLEKHMITHRDPYMAYQCMECGQSFVVKPSFSTHLLLEHNITTVEEYINNKQCYNENALSKTQQNEEVNQPLCENQCTICREQFENSEDLEKHFRVHGMAFLMKKTTNKANSC